MARQEMCKLDPRLIQMLSLNKTCLDCEVEHEALWILFCQFINQ